MSEMFDSTYWNFYFYVSQPYWIGVGFVFEMSYVRSRSVRLPKGVTSV